MSNTHLIREALIADIKSYTAWTWQRPMHVFEEPRDVSEVPKPVVVFAPGPGGTSARETLGSVAGKQQVIQLFECMLVISDRDPIKKLDDFLDDVRNSIERSVADGSTLCTIAEDVQVTDWGEVSAGGKLAQGTYVRPMTVTVRYIHSRGSA